MPHGSLVQGREHDDRGTVRSSHLKLALVVAIAVAACSTATPQPSFDFVRLLTQDGPRGGQPCSGSAIAGVLTLDPQWDLGVVEQSTGRLHATVWPPAFAAARQGGPMLLLDQDLRVVAREGDVVSVPGENHPDPNTPDGLWFACPNISNLSPSPDVTGE